MHTRCSSNATTYLRVLREPSSMVDGRWSMSDVESGQVSGQSAPTTPAGQNPVPFAALIGRFAPHRPVLRDLSLASPEQAAGPCYSIKGAQGTLCEKQGADTIKQMQMQMQMISPVEEGDARSFIPLLLCHPITSHLIFHGR